MSDEPGSDGDKPFHKPLGNLADLYRGPVRPSPEPRASAKAATAKPAPVKPPTAPRASSPAPGAPAVDPGQARLEAENSFRRAMVGVKPLAPSHGAPPAPGSTRPLSPRDEAAEVMAALDDLIGGSVPFDITCSDEHLEGLAQGIDRRLLKRLRKGEFSVAAHLDLHGLTRAEAKPLVETFLDDNRCRGKRCVLIVHGRGLHSDGREPVLKESLRTWLTRGRISRTVMAFCSALPADGGMGAIYVLLRR